MGICSSKNISQQVASTPETNRSKDIVLLQCHQIIDPYMRTFHATLNNASTIIRILQTEKSDQMALLNYEKLSHQNTMQFVSVEKYSDEHFIYLSFLNVSCSLSSYLEQNSLSDKDIKTIIITLLKCIRSLLIYSQPSLSISTSNIFISYENLWLLGPGLFASSDRFADKLKALPKVSTSCPSGKPEVFSKWDYWMTATTLINILTGYRLNIDAIEFLRRSPMEIIPRDFMNIFTPLTIQFIMDLMFNEESIENLLNHRWFKDKGRITKTNIVRMVTQQIEENAIKRIAMSLYSNEQMIDKIMKSNWEIGSAEFMDFDSELKSMSPEQILAIKFQVIDLIQFLFDEKIWRKFKENINEPVPFQDREMLKLKLRVDDNTIEKSQISEVFNYYEYLNFIRCQPTIQTTTNV